MTDFHYLYRIYNTKKMTRSANSHRIVWRSDQHESESDDMDRAQFEHFREKARRAGIEVKKAD
ncbi:MAG: hypothetical protein EOQ42_12195 [Mesorhizobium sp.]|uniref:hypothetical protein n=1 Tax=Mesorhizobium sp. TaxID=1871066 RepID=UPI000FE4EB21|nr:hypothetical protein [Mesorhizobium sp.]RWB27550.1 MAG: hypothetical protein EOQ43_27035 [Mesorhizobium sp.]RWB70038.1 MAG: hypothetical protein EOQ42_12195 [Mesorhizobium sp.]TIU74084.1 MAG: hypothetical protein E5W13_22770 [Mesorhizobium sp.]